MKNDHGLPAGGEMRKPRQARRNQLLAGVLFGVIASLFVIVVGLVVLLHYGESHHLIAGL